MPDPIHSARRSMRGLVIAGALTLILGLIISFPARVAYAWFATPAFSMSGVTGSVWRGQASEGAVAGIYLTDLRWRFRPLALFRGEAAFGISAQPVSGLIDADIGVGVGGSVRLSNVSAELPIRSLERLIPAVNGIDGDMRVQMERVVLEGGVPVDATGVVNVSNLVIRPIAASVLGDYRAIVETEGQTIRGRVQDTSGVLEVSGEIELSPDRDFSFIGLIASRAEAPAAVSDQLQYLGPADAEGRRSFRLEGEL
ncbi:MAG: type II secretion system protein N [Woeseia sp.]